MKPACGAWAASGSAGNRGWGLALCLQLWSAPGFCFWPLLWAAVLPGGLALRPWTPAFAALHSQIGEQLAAGCAPASERARRGSSAFEQRSPIQEETALDVFGRGAPCPGQRTSQRTLASLKGNRPLALAQSPLDCSWGSRQPATGTDQRAFWPSASSTVAPVFVGRGVEPELHLVGSARHALTRA